MLEVTFAIKKIMDMSQVIENFIAQSKAPHLYPFWTNKVDKSVSPDWGSSKSEMLLYSCPSRGLSTFVTLALWLF